MPTISLGRPQPKQELFLKDQHKHVAFGGARGGGKSWSLRYKAKLLCLAHAGIVVTIVRKTYPELTKNHIEPLRKELCAGSDPIARYNDSRKSMTFVNGSIIYFMYNDTDKDSLRFQGLETDVLMIDECTLFSRDQLDAMRACVRGVNSFPHRIYYTCNPNGQSMGYIKRLFIDRKFEEGENPEEYSFIQSLLTDNQALMESDPSYIKYLESLPPALKRRWLEGDWTAYEGQFFEEFRETPDAVKCEEAGITIEEAKREHRWTHVIEPFEPPATWSIYRSYDWGYGKPFSMGYWAVSPDETAYRILEVYGCTKTPNEGVRWSNKEQFDYFQKLEQEHPWLKGKRIQGVADPSIWDGSKGISAAEEADKHSIFFKPGINDRIPGWMQVRERLKFDENGFARMYFFDNCKAAIRTIPLQMFDEHKPEDLNTELEDHCPDEIRYFCMSRPIAPRAVKEEVIPFSDPLNQFEKKIGKWDAYHITRR